MIRSSRRLSGKPCKSMKLPSLASKMRNDGGEYGVHVNASNRSLLQHCDDVAGAPNVRRVTIDDAAPAEDEQLDDTAPAEDEQLDTALAEQKELASSKGKLRSVEAELQSVQSEMGLVMDAGRYHRDQQVHYMDKASHFEQQRDVAQEELVKLRAECAELHGKLQQQLHVADGMQQQLNTATSEAHPFAWCSALSC